MIETLHLARQRRWPAEFAEALLRHRRDGHLLVVEDLLSRADAMQADAIRDQLNELADVARSAVNSASTSVNCAECTTELEVTRAESLLDTFARTAAALPEHLRSAIDAALEIRHRRFMVLGVEAANKDERPFNQKAISVDEGHDFALAGLALSGGGIRSASFAAGALEALAQQGLLGAMHLVSSVSGGGYAAAWMAAWAYRHEQGIAGVEEDLKHPDGLAPAPLRWLRRHCAYLAPRRGSALSGDAWALAVAYLTRWIPILLLLLNWLLVLLLFPHALLALAKWWGRQLPDLTNAWLWTCVAVGCLTLIWLAIVRRLLMYRRLPLVTPRHSPGLRKGLAFATVGVTLLLAGGFSLLPTGPLKVGGGWPLFILVLSACSLTFFISTALAIGLALPATQRCLDLFRRHCLDHDLAEAGVLVRHSIGWQQRALSLGVGLLVLSLCLTLLVQLTLQQQPTLRTLFTVGPITILLSYGLSELTGMTLLVSDLQERDRAWAARLGGWMLVASVAGTLLFGLALWPDPLDLWEKHPKVLAVMVLAALALAGLLWRLAGGIALGNAMLALLALWLLSLLVVRRVELRWPAEHGVELVLVWCGLLASAYLLGRLLDVNRFTLHSIYKEGLVRAFLGASRMSWRHTRVKAPNDPTDIADTTLQSRQFEPRLHDPSTNIDEDDDLALAWLRLRSDRPFPLMLFNAAVNGRSDIDIDGRVPREWPFVFSPYFCGSVAPGIGYSDTREFLPGDPALPNGAGISLGTAIAVSGAAVSPVSGRLTQPVTAFLKALLNARLGLWLGNPSKAKAVRQRSARPKGTALLQEMMGTQSRFGNWIHLSDGGHFENLGLHELLRRGCLRIIVVDATCDPECSMSDLAEAFRRARIDLGVQIHRSSATAAEPSPALDLQAHRNTIWFEIEYGKDMPRGRLLYVRPTLDLHPSPPVEVTNYGLQFKKFPHEPTADQFFTETQMEAYRLLGRECMNQKLKIAMEVPKSSHDRSMPDSDKMLLLLLHRHWHRQPSTPSAVPSQT